MEEKRFQFRTAAFGGFNKQDVMAYLEQSARDYGVKLTALQHKLEEEKNAQEEQRREQEELKRHVACLEEENQRLAADLADREERLRRAEETAAQLRQKAQQLEDQVAGLTPDAQAYAAVKDRMAGIELEAHGRAQAIEREGRLKVQRLQEQVKDWFTKTKAAYDRLRGDMNATLTHASQELSRTGAGLEEIAREMEEKEDALKAIQAQLDVLEPPKAPEPITPAAAPPKERW